jgi:hypothetical protein
MSGSPKLLLSGVLCGLLAFADMGYGQVGAVGPSTAAEMPGLTGYFLLDEEAVMGFGHAALLIGSDAAGWDYYSFAPHASRDGKPNNLEHRQFATLSEAQASPALARYHKYLRWATVDTDAAARVQERIDSHWVSANYDPLRRNCFHLVADVLSAAGFAVDGGFVTPVAAYDANLARADSHGAWRTTVAATVGAN